MKIRPPSKQFFRSPARIVGISLFLVLALSAIAVARLIPTSFANVPKGAVSREPGDTGRQVAAAPVMVNARHRAPCPECGVIESMRQSERPSVGRWQGMIEAPISRDASGGASGSATGASAATVRSYQFTVRFRDGSTAVFTETSPRAWRVGSRVMVIGDARTTSK